MWNNLTLRHRIQELNNHIVSYYTKKIFKSTTNSYKTTHLSGFYCPIHLFKEQEYIYFYENSPTGYAFGKDEKVRFTYKIKDDQRITIKITDSDDHYYIKILQKYNNLAIIITVDNVIYTRYCSLNL
jgi:hypothetical protein